MHPDDLFSVCKPIIDNTADHVKEIGSFPQLLEECQFKEELLQDFVFGTSIASAMRIRDSQCGFTATRDSVLKSWNWENSGRVTDIQTTG